MPELPEVETVVRELQVVLPGREVIGASLSAKDLYRAGSREVASLAGVRIGDVRRRGKAIVVSCRRDPDGVDAAYLLIVHLGMTGRLEWSEGRRIGAVPRRSGEPVKRDHLHARWTFRDGSELRYYDPRRFGYIFVGTPVDADAVLRIGPDPFEIRAGGLASALAGRRAPVKALLLDQRIVSGLGNIYVDETLYLARVHPLTPGDRASTQAAAILSAARRVLKRAIRARGTTLRDYRRTGGERGGFQTRLLVYGREGEACASCGGAIIRLEVAQRGTHVCPRCQPRPRVSSTSSRTRPGGRSRRVAPRRAGYKRSH